MRNRPATPGLKIPEQDIFGRNLTNEVIVQNGIDFNNLAGMINDPRVVGVELVVRW